MLHRVSKKNDINRDKWIGVGGHFEEGESPEECLLREVKEETSLTLTGWRFHGIVTFVVNDTTSNDTLNTPTEAGKITDVEYMYLFTADDAEGGLDHPLPTCDEGVLEWIHTDRIETLPLWEGDKIFLRLIKENHPVFLLKLVYDEKGRLIDAILDGQKISLI